MLEFEENTISPTPQVPVSSTRDFDGLVTGDPLEPLAMKKSNNSDALSAAAAVSCHSSSPKTTGSNLIEFDKKNDDAEQFLVGASTSSTVRVPSWHAVVPTECSHPGEIPPPPPPIFPPSYSHSSAMAAQDDQKLPAVLIGR